MILVYWFSSSGVTAEGVRHLSMVGTTGAPSHGSAGSHQAGFLRQQNKDQIKDQIRGRPWNIQRVVMVATREVGSVASFR